MLLLFVSVFIIFISYELIRFNEVALPGFSYYSRCVNNTCVFKEQPKYIRTLYETYCCDREIIINCSRNNTKIGGEVCYFVCFGDYYKKGGVIPNGGYCN